ncbi:MAG: choice-of-anchor L domain-containing protein [Bacteroidales bacterium]|nr:choice-of-anchor L domain-containing protein [Bacteroidales bacterium]
MKRIFLFVCICLMLAPSITQSQSTQTLKVYEMQELNEYISYVLDTLFVGGGMIDTASITYTGHPMSIGRFESGADIGFSRGIILSNGKAKMAEGANRYGAYGDSLGFPGDEDLNRMYQFITPDGKPDTTSDAAVLSFRFRPFYSNIKLGYVFASEEYRYAGDKPIGPDVDLSHSDDYYYDVFGIFVSKTGGPFTNGAKNMAIIPSSGGTGEEWVLIHTINQSQNNTLYKENQDPPFNHYSTEFDGMTVPLNLNANLSPCTWYDIRIAIADFYDSEEDPYIDYPSNFNSAVFLEKQSLISGEGLSYTVDYHFDNPEIDTCAVIGCSNLIVRFTLNKVSEFDFKLPYNLQGFTPADIQPIPDSIIIPAGQLSTTIEIKPIAGSITGQFEYWKFKYPKDPCDVPVPPFSGGFTGVIDFRTWNYLPLQEVFKPMTADCGETVSLTFFDDIVGGFPPYNMVWSYNGNLIGTGEPVTHVVQDSPDIVDVNVSDGCSNNKTSHVQITNKPIQYQLTPGNIVEICENQSENVLITSLNQFNPTITVQWFKGNWSTPIGTFNPLNIPYDPGLVGGIDYYYRITDDCGNIKEGSIFVTQDPILSAGEDRTICFGDQTVLTSNEAVYYWWYDGDPTLPTTNLIGEGANMQSITVTPSGDTEYFLKVRSKCDPNLILQTSVHIYVEFFDAEIVSPDEPDLEICPGGTVTLVANGLGPWLWSTGETTQTISVTLNTPGIHTYSVTANTVYCTDMASVDILVYDFAQIQTTADFSEVCVGTPVTLHAAGTGAFTWSSSPNDPTLFTGNQHLTQNPVVTPAVPTTYTCAIVDLNLCEANDAVNVGIRPQPTINYDYVPQEVCTGQNVDFTYVGNGPTSAQYIWGFDGGNAVGSGPGPIVVNWTDAGVKDVTLQLIEPNCISDVFSSQVNVNPLPEPDFTADVLAGCQPFEVQFTDQTADAFGNAQYTWDFGDGNSSDLRNPVHTFLDPGKYTVSLTVANTDFCLKTKIITNYIEVYPKPATLFDADPRISTLGDPDISFTNLTPPGNFNYLWNFADGNTSTEENPIHTYTDPGTFVVNLTAESDKGCTEFYELDIVISEVAQLFIPSAFTPNGDGLNDCFEIKGTPFSNYTMKIIDRWGKVVHVSKNFEDCWEGSAEGVDLPGGTYIYIIYGSDYLGRTIEYKGSVTLIR